MWCFVCSRSIRIPVSPIPVPHVGPTCPTPLRAEEFWCCWGRLLTRDSSSPSASPPAPAGTTQSRGTTSITKPQSTEDQPGKNNTYHDCVSHLKPQLVPDFQRYFKFYGQDGSNKLSFGTNPWKCLSSICSYGYPDADYLRRVEEELAAKGVQWPELVRGGVQPALFASASHQSNITNLSPAQIALIQVRLSTLAGAGLVLSRDNAPPPPSELGLCSLLLSGAAAAPLYLHVLTFRQKSRQCWPVFLIKMFIPFQCLTRFKYNL